LTRKKDVQRGSVFVGREEAASPGVYRRNGKEKRQGKWGGVDRNPMEAAGIRRKLIREFRHTTRNRARRGKGEMRKACQKKKSAARESCKSG